MARYDVYRVVGALVVDVQTDLLDGFPTRLVAPLLPVATAPVAHKRLNPTVQIDGAIYTMNPQYLAAVRVKDLGPPIGSLDHRHDDIRAALDMIFLGF